MINSFLLALLSTLTPFIVANAAAENKKPNILLILSDDAGYHDFGFQGSKSFKTPHLDKIAKEGVKFDQAYVTASMCAPSRAGLLTGIYQQRFGYYLNLPHILKPEVGIPYDQATFGDLMKQAGYRTAAIGKWHLGYTPGHHPNQQGFDSFWGFIGGSRSYFPPNPDKPFSKSNTLQYNGKPIPDDKYLSDKLTDFAIEFIEKKGSDQPFFIYLAYNAVHTPMHSKKSDIDAFSQIKNKSRRTLAGMTKGLDDNVGRLMNCLKKNEIDDNTLVIFLNDNGGAPASRADNAPFKGAKGTHSEGGLRVPMLMRFPHHLPAGKSISTPVISLDILPTALSIIHSSIPQDLDGINLLPIINHKNTAILSRPLFWALSKHIQTVRLGNKKLIRLKLSTETRYYLYNLEKDIAETTNLASQQPEVVQSLNRLINQWSATTPDPVFRKTMFTTDKDILKRYEQFEQIHHYSQ